MRILHLIDDRRQQGPPEGALSAVAILQQQDRDNEHLLIALTAQQDTETARLFGVALGARLGVCSDRARSAAQAIEPMLGRLGRLGRLGPIDRVQAWSPQTRRIARRIIAERSVLPPAPPDPPMVAGLLSARQRDDWRRRFGIATDEIAIALLEQEGAPSEAGNFGLTMAPLTCAIQDRDFIGLIPGRAVTGAAARAARYAKTANEVWRIESIAAPRFAVALAADAVLFPSAAAAPERWHRWSSTQLALRCANLMSIPVVTGSFQGSQPITQPIGSALSPRRPGRVGMVTSLFESLVAGAPLATEPQEEQSEIDDWLDRWRAGCRERPVAVTVD